MVAGAKSRKVRVGCCSCSAECHLAAAIIVTRAPKGGPPGRSSLLSENGHFVAFSLSILSMLVLEFWIIMGSLSFYFLNIENCLDSKMNMHVWRGMCRVWNPGLEHEPRRSNCLRCIRLHLMGGSIFGFSVLP